jgi:hypothetical protein
VFAFAAPAGCSILSCIDVIGQAVCIAEAIDDEDWQGILKCAKRKEVCCSPFTRRPWVPPGRMVLTREKLCGCAGCFSALGGFLEKYGLC